MRMIRPRPTKLQLRPALPLFLKGATRLLAVFFALAAGVLLLGLAADKLSDAGQKSRDALVSIPAPPRFVPDNVASHRVDEWPPDRPRLFREAPALASLVQTGKLPPIEERLPEDPLVIVPHEQMGPYGGTWTRYSRDLVDASVVFDHRLTYENLVRWCPRGKELLPNMATHWEVEDGGRSFTFHLRRGVRWSDGHPFTAEDIEFWYHDFLLEPGLTPVINSEFIIDGELMGFEKLDDYTVRFTFSKPNSLFLPLTVASGYLAGANIFLPKHYLKQFHPNYVTEEEMNRRMRQHRFDIWHRLFENRRETWTNPDRPTLYAWQLAKAPPANPLVFHRNPYYWKVDAEGNQLPYIDRLDLHLYSPEIINARASEGDIGMQLRHMRIENYPLFMEKSHSRGYRVDTWQSGSGNVLVLAPNLSHPDPVLREIFHDRRFRIALSISIDRHAINEVLYFGAGKPRQVAPQEFSPYYWDEYEKIWTEFDPAEANRLLDEMGLIRRDRHGYRLRPDGKTLMFSIDTIELPGSGGDRGLPLVVQNWRAIGVRADINRIARPLWLERREAWMFDFGVFEGELEHQPILEPRWFLPFNLASMHAIGYLRWYESGGKRGDKPPPDMHQAWSLYQEIKHTMDPEKQQRLWRGIMEINHRNLWVIGTVGHVPVVSIVKNSFRNVPRSSIVSWSFRTPGNTAPEAYAIDREGTGE